MNCEELPASIATWPPATEPVPWTVNGRKPSPPSSTAHAKSLQGSHNGSHGAHAGRAGSPSNVTAPLTRAASGGTKRITVPARPQSTAMPPVGRREAGRDGGDHQIRDVTAAGNLGDAGAQGPQGADHQIGVAGLQGRAQAGFAVGNGGEDKIPVGQRLGGRNGDCGIQGCCGEGCGPKGWWSWVITVLSRRGQARGPSCPHSSAACWAVFLPALDELFGPPGQAGASGGVHAGQQCAANQADVLGQLVAAVGAVFLGGWCPRCDTPPPCSARPSGPARRRRARENFPVASKTPAPTWVPASTRARVFSLASTGRAALSGRRTGVNWAAVCIGVAQPVKAGEDER